MNKYLLIDGNSIMNRAFFGLPLLKNSNGLYTNAVFGFLNIMFKIIEQEQPTHIGVAFDLKAPTFRHKLYDAYKGTRTGMADELREQMPVIKEILTAMNIPLFQMEGYEADDLLGTLSHNLGEMGHDVVLLSGDKDYFQLVDTQVKLLLPKTKGGETNLEVYTVDAINELYGIAPKQFIDIKGLMGDSSDNIPGVPGIGEKTALKIIQTYHTIEEAYLHIDEVGPKKAKENMIAFKEQAFLSKELGTICLEVPLDSYEFSGNRDELLNNHLYNLFLQYEFTSLVSKYFKESPKLEAPSKNNSHLERIETFDALTAILPLAQNVKTLSLLVIEEQKHLIGMGIRFNEVNYFIEINDQINAEAFWQWLDSVGPNTQLLVFDGKAQLRHILEAAKVKKFKPKEVFDYFLIAYLLDSAKDKYMLSDLSLVYLKKNIQSLDHLLGTGKNRNTILSLDMETFNSYICEQIETLDQLYPIISATLEEMGLTILYRQMEMPLMWVLLEMELIGIKTDSIYLNEYSKMLAKSINELIESIYLLAGETFNLNSPKQLGELLFEKLKLPPLKKTKTGYSTDQETLEALEIYHPIAQELVMYRQLAKLQSTYAEALPRYIEEDGRIHSTFNQGIAATGRISSIDPNLQNIPVRLALGRKLRQAFVPEQNWVFIDADYSQIELRLLAHLSEDESFIQAFKEGVDIHQMTASKVFHTPYEQVTKEQRRNAKAVIFGIVYGISAFGLSRDLKISQKEAKGYIDSFFVQYPRVEAYLKECIAFAKENGYSITLMNRKRLIPELKSSNFNIRSFGERIAMNTPIQGGAADIIKQAMINVSNRLQKEGLNARLVLQVHDELLIEAPTSELDKVKALLIEEMENALELKVPMLVECSIGNNWYEAK